MSSTELTFNPACPVDPPPAAHNGEPLVFDEKAAALQANDFDLSFKIFHELMSHKVAEILLVSSPYDAYIMEEEGRLAERIIHEYRGLNLSRPPKLTWVSSAQEAFEALARKRFDLLLTMPRLEGMETYLFCEQLKQRFPDLPVFLLLHTTGRFLLNARYSHLGAVDKIWIWSGNSDLLLAMIKSVEDRWNVANDTRQAKVRVIILVEDSPEYFSSLLPLLYKVVVTQTQDIMEDSLNDEHRLLKMRARPKILLAENYEDALYLYKEFKPYLLCVISDVRYPRNGKSDPAAGFRLLSMIKSEIPDLPLLNMSNEISNRQKAERIPAVFLDKNDPALHNHIQSFFAQYLGFGDFVFRLPDGTPVATASNLTEMENVLPGIPDESIQYHAMRNHFSTWLMARSEIHLSSRIKPIKTTDFNNLSDLKNYLAARIRQQRKSLQRGVVLEFSPEIFDPEADLMKIGKGSLGGKARGLAFFTTRLKDRENLDQKFPDIRIVVPKTLVISTEGFDSFMALNGFKSPSAKGPSDVEIKKQFLAAEFPAWLAEHLRLYLQQVHYPLAVRSSSLLEDAQFQPFAGIYKTYMIPNCDPDPEVRLQRLIQAIKLVYASTWLAIPRAYANSTHHRVEEEKMAVIIQQLTGSTYGDYFFPALSGVGQSYNYYPIAHMESDDGIAHIALGLGRTVVEGGSALRFSPPYPQFLPQFSAVDDILKNAQRYFYAMRLNAFPHDFGLTDHAVDTDTLKRLEMEDLFDRPGGKPLHRMFSSYLPAENRIRDTIRKDGYPVLTFANILKHESFPLPQLLTEILAMGQRGMGCPVEIEFAVHLPDPTGPDATTKGSEDGSTEGEDRRPVFALLQIRPMATSQEHLHVSIAPDHYERAFCHSEMALGNGQDDDICDIVFVKPDAFDPARTVAIADEIGRMNQRIEKTGRRYLLIGPGRWGSADQWWGIPVTWKEISGVKAIVEAAIDQLQADPSQGSHFFHNITSLGISYVTIADRVKSFLDWEWLQSLPVSAESDFTKHLRLTDPISVMVDGRNSRAVMLKRADGVGDQSSGGS